MAITFHLDEHIPQALANALRHRGIDVTTTTEAGLEGAEDRQHLAYAANTDGLWLPTTLIFFACTPKV